MLSIGTFSKLSNTTTKTLRYYDEIGLLKPAYISVESGYRYYHVGQLEIMILINKLKGYDFTLDEIAAVLKEQSGNALLLSLMHQKKNTLAAKLESYRFLLGQLAQDTANLERGINLMAYLENIAVKLVETEPMNLLYIRTELDVSEYGNYIGKLFEKIAADKLTPVGEPMSVFHSKEFIPEHYDMEIAVPIKERVNGTRDFPSYLCATATLKGPYSQLTSIYAKIQKWIEEKGYIPNAAPFEIYRTNPSKTAPTEFLTDIYFPIRI